MRLKEHLRRAGGQIFSSRFNVRMAIPAGLIVDMKSKEQNQISEETRLIALALEPYFAVLRQRTGIDLSVDMSVRGSRLVNPHDSAVVSEDSVRAVRRVSETAILTASKKHQRVTRVIYGLALLLGIKRAHVAPRDDVNHNANTQGNVTGSTYLALLRDGQVISSVGPTALSLLKKDITRLWEINPALWATLHGSPAAIRAAEATQYTALAHSPYINLEFIKCAVIWLCNHPHKISDVIDSDKRLHVQKQILGKFFSRLERRYHKNKHKLANSTTEDKAQALITEITDRKDSLIQEPPPHIVTGLDEFGIVSVQVSANEWAALQEECMGDDVYALVNTRRYHTSGKGSHAISMPQLVCAAFRPKIFTGDYGRLVLGPRLHGSTDNGDGTCTLNFFVQMNTNQKGEHPFDFRGSAQVVFERDGGKLDIGHEVYAIVKKQMIDELVKDVKEEWGLGFFLSADEHVTPQAVILALHEEGLLNGADASALHRALDDETQRVQLIAMLTDKLSGSFSLEEPAREAGQILNSVAPAGLAAT